MEEKLLNKVQYFATHDATPFLLELHMYIYMYNT